MWCVRHNACTYPLLIYSVYDNIYMRICRYDVRATKSTLTFGSKLKFV